MAEHTIKEKIEFLTQIHTAWDSTEQRMSLRKRPRRYISYRYTSVDDYEAQWMRSLCFAQQGKQVDFPMWHNAFILCEDLFIFQSRIKLRSQDDIWGFRDCPKVLLVSASGSSDTYKLDSVSSNYLHLGEQVVNDFAKDVTLVVPVFYAMVLQNSDYTNEYTDGVDSVINVELIQSIDQADISAYFDEENYPIRTFEYGTNLVGDYNGLEMFLITPQWSEGNSATYEINADFLDNESGRHYYHFKSSSPLATHSITYILRDKSELHYLERFFYRHRGSFKSFFMPTWTNDFTLIEDALTGDNELIVKLELYYKYYSAIKRRRRIIIFYKDGTGEIIQLAGFSYTTDGKKGKIFLKNALGHDVLVNNIVMISFFVCVRFDSDVLELNHETVDTAVVTLDIKELNDE